MFCQRPSSGDCPILGSPFVVKGIRNPYMKVILEKNKSCFRRCLLYVGYT